MLTYARPDVINKRATDAAALMLPCHGKVGQVAAITEVRQRPGNTYQPAVVVGANDQIGMPEHLLEARQVIARAANAGGLEEVSQLLG